MKKTTQFILVIICCYQTSIAQVLTQKSAFIEPRERAFSFMLGNKFYTGTGRDDNGVMNNHMYEYNVATDTWSQLNDFPTQPVRNGISMVINDTAYAGFAWDGTNNIGWYQYNVTSDTWTLKNSSGNASSFAGTFSINGKGYAACGSGLSGEHNELWEYDPALDLWTQKANFPGAARDFPFADTMGGFAFVGMGDFFFAPPFYSDMYKYDVGADTWSAIAPIPNSSTGAIAVGGCSFHASWNGKIILMGIWGISTSSLADYNTIYVYDPPSDSWTLYENSNPIGARGTALTAQNGSKAYYGAGDDFITGIKQDFWEVDLNAAMTAIENANPYLKDISVKLSSHNIYVKIPDELSIKGNIGMDLFSVDGKIVKQILLTGSDFINVNTLAAGAYVYMIKSNERTLKSGKVIVD